MTGVHQEKDFERQERFSKDQMGDSLGRVKNKTVGKDTVDHLSALADVYSMLGIQAISASGRGLSHQLPISQAEIGGLTDQAREHDQKSATRVSKIFRSGEDEKKRIARELHDGLGQLLTSINLHVQQCLKTTDSADDLPEEMRESLQGIAAMTKQAMSEVRGICGSLRPAILDDLGVLAAIKWQCRMIVQGHDHLKVTTDLEVHEAMIPEESKTAIYRIAQEALNNAVKYADAENLLVRIHHGGDYLKLEIEDDGVGFDTDDAPCGMGLLSMRERAESIGGVFSLQSRPGKGVVIRALFPQEPVALSG